MKKEIALPIIIRSTATGCIPVFRGDVPPHSDNERASSGYLPGIGDADPGKIITSVP